MQTWKVQICWTTIRLLYYLFLIYLGQPYRGRFPSTNKNQHINIHLLKNPFLTEMDSRDNTSLRYTFKIWRKSAWLLSQWVTHDSLKWQTRIKNSSLTQLFWYHKSSCHKVFVFFWFCFFFKRKQQNRQLSPPLPSPNILLFQHPLTTYILMEQRMISWEL